MFKKVFLGLTVFVLSGFYLFGTTSANSADIANRRTAIRYLQLAKDFASQKNWDLAESNSSLGMNYDNSISDLWYINAISKTNKNFPKRDIKNLVQTALIKNNWVDYNKENAKVLYADILCSTCKFEEALKILDEERLVYSADAELIRSRCYYNLKGAENLEKARSKIETARRVYPNDARFIDLFLKFEFSINEVSDGVRPEKVQKIADSIIKAIPDMAKIDTELELYASFFAEKEKRIRMLKSYNARGNKSPLYAIAALENGLMNQEDALDYYLKFAEKECNHSQLEKIVTMITDEASKDYLRQHLEAYNGVIFSDTDGDLVPNLRVKFMRGRAQQIVFDRDQDDVFDWDCECDFGAPVYVHFADEFSTVRYGNWPSVTDIEYYWDSKEWVKLHVASESMNYSPFGMKPNDVIKNCLDFDFYYPFIIEPYNIIDIDTVLDCALSINVPSQEVDYDTLKISIFNKKAQMIRYYKGEQLYAQAQCDENGRPVSRIVDRDMDGLFETTEYFGWDSQNDTKKYYSNNDSLDITKNIFGLFGELAGDFVKSGFYLKMIQVDFNGDTVPDFTEEYIKGEGKISTWDFDNDGIWDTRYIKYPASEDGVLREESLFNNTYKKRIQSVLFENSKPVLVKDGENELSVTKGTKNLYWIGQPGSEETAKEIFRKNYEQGNVQIVQCGAVRVFVIRIGDMIFGEIISDNQDE